MADRDAANAMLSHVFDLSSHADIADHLDSSLAGTGFAFDAAPGWLLAFNAGASSAVFGAVFGAGCGEADRARNVEVCDFESGAGFSVGGLPAPCEFDGGVATRWVSARGWPRAPSVR